MTDVMIGWDPRESEVADICRFSIERRSSLKDLNVSMIKLSEVRAKGLYWREHERRAGTLWDVISEAPMSTEFAISRFLTPFLASGDWAIFCDCDFLWRADLAELLELVDERYAVMCVKHIHEPPEQQKMDDQIQTRYQRKNWSSMMVWNLRHPGNARLTLDMVNQLPGRDLHRFCWLEDDEIGEIPVEWNWLEGHSSPSVDPKVIHYTRGGPWFNDFQNVDYAQTWLDEASAWQKTLSEESAGS